MINRIDQISSGQFHIFKGQCHQDSVLVENLARIFIPVEIAKNDCLYEKGKLHVWKKSFFGIHNMCRESGDSNGATRTSGKSCEKGPVYS